MQLINLQESLDLHLIVDLTPIIHQRIKHNYLEYGLLRYISELNLLGNLNRRPISSPFHMLTTSPMVISYSLAYEISSLNFYNTSHNYDNITMPQFFLPESSLSIYEFSDPTLLQFYNSHLSLNLFITAAPS